MECRRTKCHVILHEGWRATAHTPGTSRCCILLRLDSVLQASVLLKACDILGEFGSASAELVTATRLVTRARPRAPCVWRNSVVGMLHLGGMRTAGRARRADGDWPSIFGRDPTCDAVTNASVHASRRPASRMLFACCRRPLLVKPLLLAQARLRSPALRHTTDFFGREPCKDGSLSFRSSAAVLSRCVKGMSPAG
jgi:hypothetical protein